MHSIAEYVSLLIATLRSFLMSRLYGDNSSRGCQNVFIFGPDGSSAEILLYGGQIVSWKNKHGDELLYMSRKPVRKFSKITSGGITVCFEQRFRQSDMCTQHEYIRNKMWSIENLLCSQVDLVYKSKEEDTSVWPHYFELRIRVTIRAGELQIIPQVKNIDRNSFSFTFSLRNYFTISDISEVRVEGLDTLEYIDNKLYRSRKIEQADALTFDKEIDRSYLNTPNKLEIIDHGKRRTFLLTKRFLPDSVIWNPWDKFAPAYKTLLSIDSAIVEHPIWLPPSHAWKGFQTITSIVIRSGWAVKYFGGLGYKESLIGLDWPYCFCVETRLDPNHAFGSRNGFQDRWRKRLLVSD